MAQKYGPFCSATTLFTSMTQPSSLTSPCTRTESPATSFGKADILTPGLCESRVTDAVAVAALPNASYHFELRLVRPLLPEREVEREPAVRVEGHFDPR